MLGESHVRDYEHHCVISHIERLTHREINFPFKRMNSDVAWAAPLPWGSRVFRFWRGVWVTALMSQDASWPRLISADMFWIFWQCCPGLWLHSWPSRYISRYQGSLLRIMIIVTHIVPVRWLWLEIFARADKRSHKSEIRDKTANYPRISALLPWTELAQCCFVFLVSVLINSPQVPSQLLAGLLSS